MLITPQRSGQRVYSSGGEEGTARRVEHAMIREPFLLLPATAGCHTSTEATESEFG